MCTYAGGEGGGVLCCVIHKKDANSSVPIPKNCINSNVPTALTKLYRILVFLNATMASTRVEGHCSTQDVITRFRPLERFYEHSHEIFPDQILSSPTRAPLRYQDVEPSALSNEARTILCNDGYLTLALSKHHGEALGLKVLEMIQEDGMVHRSINLVKQSTGLVASLGLISIHLDQMPNDEARAQVREGVIPFGRILFQHGVVHRSSSMSPFVIENNMALSVALSLTSSSGHLYGRTNTIITSDGHVLAQVVEVLPFDFTYDTTPISPVALTSVLPKLFSTIVQSPKSISSDSSDDCISGKCECSSTATDTKVSQHSCSRYMHVCCML